MTFRSLLAWATLATTLGACGTGSTVGGGSVFGTPPYESGDWSGLFNIRYRTPSGSTSAYSFRVNIRMRFLASDGTTAGYVIDHVSTTEPFFGCESGCDLPFASGVVNLPASPGGVGPGSFSITFPNGRQLYSNGTVFTNSLGLSFAADAGMSPTSRFLTQPVFNPLPAGSQVIELTWVFN